MSLISSSQDLQIPKMAIDAASAKPLNKTARIDPEQARKAAQDFESVFLSQYIGFMFEGIRTDGMFGGGTGEDIFRSLLVQEYGRLIAERGGVGIADAVMTQLIAMQETRHDGS